MSRAATLARIRDLKEQVLGLCDADGLAGEAWARELAAAAALRLETLGKRLEASAGRRGTQFTPPARPGHGEQPDWREKQLPRGDR